MTLWLVRAGRHGEREDFALENKVAVIGWDEVPDLSDVKTREELLAILHEKFPDQKDKTLKNWESQLWAFAKRIQPGDLVALPLKRRSVIAIGKVENSYKYNASNPGHARHTRTVTWLNEFPRTHFGQDLLHSLGAAMTVGRIQRNNAETRINNMLDGKKDSPIEVPDFASEADEEEAAFDIEQYARDQIIAFINSKFKGHGLERLVGAILEAQGYKVKIAPEGPDGGVDIIAGRGSLGFEPPRLAVQVKSSDSPVDVSVLRELQGVMSTFNADLGLIVAWGGYRGTVEKEATRHFFKIRMWDSNELVLMVQEYYDRLPDTIQAELPLKRIWALVQDEE